MGAHVGKGGGLGLQTFQLFNWLRQHIDVQLLCLDAPGVHRGLSDDPDVILAGPLEFPKGIGYLRRSLRSLRDEYDAFQVLDPYYSLPAACLADVFPRAIFFGTDPIAEIGWRYGPLAAGVVRAMVPSLLARGVLVVNSQSLAARFPKYAPRVIPNGVDFRVFDQLPERMDARRLLGLPEGRPLLAFVGKVIPVKRVEWLLEVLRRLPDVNAVVVGGYTEDHYGDAYYRELMQTYSDVRDRLTFAGEVVWDRVPDYLAAADVFVFPSKFEGQPNAVLEAMAAGLPVVASDIPAHRELIRHGETGFLASDPASMSRFVSDLMRDDGLRHRMGSEGRAYVREHLSTQASAAGYLELYRSMVQPRVD